MLCFLVSVVSDNNLNSKVEVQNQVILFTPESHSNPGVSSCGYTILVSGYHNASKQISNSYYRLSVMSFKMIHDDPNMMSFIINHFHLLTLNFKFWKQLGFQNSRYTYLLYLSLWPNYALEFTPTPESHTLDIPDWFLDITMHMNRYQIRITY